MMAGRFFEFLLGIGDDALVLGHRLSEWCGHGPFLEEDIAMTNIALDLVGRADAILKLAGEVEGRGRTADDFAFFRDAVDFRNVALVELPRGDFAFTMVRQFIFDAYALPLYEQLTGSSSPKLKGISEKAVKESTYHLRHSAEWVRRLGGGTTESRRRASEALRDLWLYTNELFTPVDVSSTDEEGLIPVSMGDVRDAWSAVVNRTLSEAGLTAPELEHYFDGSRRGRHTEYLGHMLSEMQIVARSHPGAAW